MIRHNSIFYNSKMTRVYTAHSKNDTAYLVIKGFLADSEFHSGYYRYLSEISKINGSVSLFGYDWDTGAPFRAAIAQFISILGRIPLPLNAQVFFKGLNQIRKLTGAKDVVEAWGDAQKNALETAEHLAEHLESLTNDYKHVHILAHSLGGYLTMKALEEASCFKRKIRSLSFFGAAIKEDEICTKSMGINVQHVYNYYSDNDSVLVSGTHKMCVPEQSRSRLCYFLPEWF